MLTASPTENTRSACRLLPLLLAFGCLGFAPKPAWAAGDPSVSQSVGAPAPIIDEFGQRLRGTDPSAGRFGLPVVEGDVIQVMLATDSAIYPPATDGTPDARNQILMTARIGRGVSPAIGDSGKFGATVAPRPGGNSRIFARVYNSATLEDASFYGDSQIFTVRSWLNEPFMVSIAATDTPLDPADDDNDGLNNSWEKSYGTDPNAKDTDGDGFSDGAETLLIHEDPLDADAFLRIVDVLPVNEQDALLEWDSRAEVTYRIEHAATPLDTDPPFNFVAAVLADGDRTSFLIPNGLADPSGCYRIRVVGN